MFSSSSSIKDKVSLVNLNELFFVVGVFHFNILYGLSLCVNKENDHSKKIKNIVFITAERVPFLVNELCPLHFSMDPGPESVF